MEEDLLFHELGIECLVGLEAFLLPQEVDPLPFCGAVVHALGESAASAAGFLPIPTPKGTGLRSKFFLLSGLVGAVNVI
jgi:hypothetical protein